MWGIYTILIHTVKEHLTITVFGKGQYGVVTIVFPDLLFYFLFSLFFVHPVQLLTAPNIFLMLLISPVVIRSSQMPSDAFQGARCNCNTSNA